MSPARKATKKAAKAAGPKATLEQIPITHHAVSCALSKAGAALDLLHVAEEHFVGESLAWMHTICIDVIGEELARAQEAYVKAVSDKTAVATEAAR